MFIEFDSFIPQCYTGAMDDRRKTLTAVAIIIGFFVLVIVVVGVLISRKTIISPVPEDNAIKIIFISATPSPIPISPSITPAPTVIPTKKSS